MKTISAIIFTVLLCSCGRNGTNQYKKTGSIRVIDLSSEPESRLSTISEIASDIEYIPLETKDNSLIKEIDKIIIHENYIYIRANSGVVLCFNVEGQFLYKLDKRGRGPEEYLVLYDFDISSDDKVLVILSPSKVLIFNNTGTGFEFKKSINLKQPSPSLLGFVPETDNILFSIAPIYGSEFSLNYLININGDTLCFKPNCYRYERVDKFTREMPNECLQYKIENSLCFKEEFSDTVFSFRKESQKFFPWLIFDSHERKFPVRIRYDTEFAKRYSGEIYWVYLIFELPRYIIYSYQHYPMRQRIIYDKKINKKYKIELINALYEDISGGPNFDPNACSGGKLLSWIDAITLKKYIDSEDFKNKTVHDYRKKEKLKKLAESLKDTDNPVLIVVKPIN